MPTIIMESSPSSSPIQEPPAKLLGAALTLLFHIENQWRGANEFLRSPSMRAERAKLKSCKDDDIIAQGKRSAALGCVPEMISSFFPSGLARLWRAKPEGKKEVGWGGVLPRAAASAALPWAIIRPPRWGSGKANQRAPLDAVGWCCLCAGAHSRRASEPECSANECRWI